ncbi:S-adenosyl-L-methionine-dependent methyltransferase [Rhypophila decipiens]|uniref:S-adenosyl-L-methionine-dependent methyltransferase n=1 Tax=Rhypophila decipiens TaxID=261697 RepID=A0AAN6XUL9_9PEZI|nr:S-adenosyl-L-methionine-dependent methyltransferase [Rhypophila decipiens]
MTGTGANGPNGGANGNGNGTASPTIHPSIILHPNDLASVPSLIKEILSKGSLLSSSPYNDHEYETARLSLVQAAHRLVISLEKPRETMIRQTWANTAGFSVLTIGIEAGIWASLASSSSPQTVSQIHTRLPSHAANFHKGYLSRILKHAAAMGYITETGPDTYLASNFIKSLTIPIMGSGYSVFSGPGRTGGARLPMLALPAWLQENGYEKEPEGPMGPFQHAHDTKLNMFEWFHANPPAGEWFNLHMGGYAFGRPNWFDDEIYPVRERLIDGFKDREGEALLVDIGGGLGHDIEAFASRFPDAKGRLVLQDLEHVIEQGLQTKVEGSRVERTVYDFHTEQPVKGARAYYMHSILHDWSDDICVKIIANIKEAMKPGYSRLLIDEGVIPDTGASWEATGLDMILSGLLSSRERTRAEWTRLLEEKAGLKINKIYHYLGDASRGTTSLIECELV